MTYNDCWTYPKDKIDEMTKAVLTDITGDFTPETGVTVTDKRIVQKGNIVEVYFYATLSAQIGSSSKKLGTITGVTKGSMLRTICGTGTHAYDAYHPAYIVKGDTGVIEVLASTTTDTVVVVHLMYTV